MHRETRLRLKLPCLVSCLRRQPYHLPAQGTWCSLETHSVPLRAHFLVTGRFIGAMPKSIASRSPVKILPVELPVRPWSFAIFTLKDRTLSPAADRFIAHIRNFARSSPANGPPRHR